MAGSALWVALVRRTAEALDSGALRPLATRGEIVEDAGLRFVVRTLETLERKRTAAARRCNPFLPYDEAMFVADVSRTHVALLNKYNVIEHHLLIVTRVFEDQTTPLSPADFEALCSCLADFEGLGFYNGGREAGASQSHKHLQLVPLPLLAGERGAPIGPRLEAAGSRPGAVPGLPFRHAAVRLDGRGAPDPTTVLSLYREMLEMLDVRCRPYNLLVTREWMLCVPRSCESFESVSVNALGFAGSLFVRSSEELQRVKAAGPMRVLREVGFPL